MSVMGRVARRRLRKAARRAKGEPLAPDDWAVFFELASGPSAQRFKRVLRALPASPRCGICGAPFAGFGARLVRPLGYRQSRKSPTLCDTCVEASPPGGMTLQTGVLFADIRGFTSLSERSDPAAVSALLRRFYAAAEDVLFPEALIDKLIGDEVMALYLPYGRLREEAPEVMLDHARRLLAAVGYGDAPVPSPRSASASTTARPSSATSAATPTATSPRSATSSTSPPGCRGRRPAARSSPRPGSSSASTRSPASRSSSS